MFRCLGRALGYDFVEFQLSSLELEIFIALDSFMWMVNTVASYFQYAIRKCRIIPEIWF